MILIWPYFVWLQATLLSFVFLRTLTIFCGDSIAIVKRCTIIAGGTKCVISTFQTFAAYGIAWALFIGIDVTRTIARLTNSAFNRWLTIEAAGTSLTFFTRIAFAACAMDFVTILRYFTRGGKTSKFYIKKKRNQHKNNAWSSKGCRLLTYFSRLAMDTHKSYSHSEHHLWHFHGNQQYIVRNDLQLLNACNSVQYIKRILFKFQLGFYHEDWAQRCQLTWHTPVYKSHESAWLLHWHGTQ